MEPNELVTAIITSKDSDVKITFISSSPTADNRKEVFEMALDKLTRLIGGRSKSSQRKVMAGLTTNSSLLSVLHGLSDSWISGDGEYTLTIIEE